MTQIHEVKCDVCSKRVPLKWNGEHYLPPVGWVNLYDNNSTEMIDVHLCPDCKPKIKKSKLKK